MLFYRPNHLIFSEPYEIPTCVSRKPGFKYRWGADI